MQGSRSTRRALHPSNAAWVVWGALAGLAIIFFIVLGAAILEWLGLVVDPKHRSPDDYDILTYLDITVETVTIFRR